MKFLVPLAVLASLVSASPVNKRDSPLKVKITKISNTLIKASVTNSGAEALNIFTGGTFLDKAPIQKLGVYRSSAAVPFTGVRVRYQTTGLDASHFVPIAAGATIDVNVELASVHDLSTGGRVDVVASGALQYTTKGSTTITSSAVYDSNVLNIDVDGAQAASISSAVDHSIAKRSRVSTDCTGARLTSTTTALRNCVSLANAAATAASSGSATKFSEYFKTTDATRRSSVAARFRSVAAECGSTTSGGTQSHCVDTYGYCSSNVLAYTLPSQNYVVNCPLYFSALPALTRTCHAQDQATTTLHEFTHAPAVVSPGTQDNGYGYSAATKLSATAAYNNADTYALYANAIYAGC